MSLHEKRKQKKNPTKTKEEQNFLNKTKMKRIKSSEIFTLSRERQGRITMSRIGQP